MLSVGSNTESRTGGICGVKSGCHKVRLKLTPAKEFAYSEAGSNGSHNIENFGVASSRHIGLIIAKDSVKERWDEVVVDCLQIFCFLNICLH